jgi:bifunctional UDP-N-acetylglucosamine pyrophosphorylase/glucosamine-1-phosphate N-acetyltransferase
MRTSKKSLFLFLLTNLSAFGAASYEESAASEVLIGTNVHIASTAQVSGKSSIGDNSSVGHYSILENVTIGKGVKILSHCVLTNVTLEDDTVVGPFAHLHDGSIIQKGAVIGNFVEVTRSIVGERSKVKHLTYLGDAHLGKNVNVGAGTITCNYDGVNKSKTVIEDDALIGSNNCLVAPITIGSGAMTGAGSTLTIDVPAHALAIARSHQTNKEIYATKLLEKNLAKKKAKENEAR